MNRVHLNIFLVFLTVFTVGCPATTSLPSPELQFVKSAKGTELATVISDSCLITDDKSGIKSFSELAPFAAALLAAVVPKAIDKGLDYASARLKAAAAAQTTSLVARTSGYLYTIDSKQIGSEHLYSVQPNNDARCLHVIAFADGSADQAAQAWKSITALAKEAQDQTVNLDFLSQNPHIRNYLTDGVPVFISELRLWRYPADKAFVLVPTFVAYGEPLSGEEPDGKARALTLTVALSGADRKTFYTDTVNLGAWIPGIAFGPQVATRFTPALGSIPSPPEQAIKLAASFSTMSEAKLEQNIMALSDYSFVLPFTAEVTVVETKEGKKWLATLAEVLAESKTGVGAALTEQILPEKKAAADLAEQQAELTLQQAFELSLIDVEVACATWEGADDPTKLTKWKAVVDARFKANAAAIAAGEAIRFPDPLAKTC